MEQDRPVQDDRVGRKPGKRGASESDHIGEEPGGTGEGDDVADTGSGVHEAHEGAGHGQPDADGQVGDPPRRPGTRHRCHSATIPSTATAPTVRSGRPYLDHRRQRVATQLPLRKEPANGGRRQLRTIGRRIATRDEDHDRPRVELGEPSGQLEAVQEGQLDVEEYDVRPKEP